jgi:glycosyl transferase family 9 (putative heptosyltransferase)
MVGPYRFPRGIMLRVGVPPGVGDVYWALTKLRQFRDHHGARGIVLYVQKTTQTRALEWAALVPEFVNASGEKRFRPDGACLSAGYSQNYPGMHCVLWPNGVLDRGGTLADWMPELGAPDLSFKVHAKPPDREVRAVVYVSSTGINHAWAPNLGPEYWRELIEELGDLTGAPPILIGKDWDREFFDTVRGRVVNLIGRTTLVEVAGIIQAARVLVGVISGMTILANHFRTPCVALHPVVPLNPRAWVAADAPYATIPAPQAPPARALAKIAASLMR